MNKKPETRGRKKNPNGNIVSNGLFDWQWERICKDASKEGLDGGAVKLRQIVDWYYTSKQLIAEREDGDFTHIDKFNKLSNKPPK